MTLRGGPIGSSSAATTVPGWRADEFAHLQTDLFTAGVVKGYANELAVSQHAAGANMSVDVATGKALISVLTTLLTPDYTFKTWLTSDAVTVVSVPTADNTNERIDRIIAKFDPTVDPNGSAANIVSIELVEGTPAGSPSAPATPANSISLATISVPAGDTTIATAQITDTRSFIDLATGALPDVVRQASLTATNTKVTNLENDAPSWLGTITGTDTLTGSATPTIAGYADGQRFAFFVAATNTGAVTLNVDSKGAVAIVRSDGAVLVAGDLVANGLIEVRKKGTSFYLISTPGIAMGKTSVKTVANSYADSSATGNVTSATAFDNGQYTIPANDIVAGVTYRFSASGTGTRGTSGTFILVIILGSTTVANVTLPAADGNHNWSFEGCLIGTAAANASVAVRYWGTATTDANSTIKTVSFNGTANVATNAEKIFKYGCYFGTSHGSNTALMSNSLIEKLSTSLFS